MENQPILEVSLRDYKKKIDDLRASLLALDKTSEDYRAIAEDIRDRQTKLNEVMAVGKKNVEAVEGSYTALSQKMSELKKEWKDMVIGTEEWIAKAKEIDEINNQLKDADAQVGVFSRNVGSYGKMFEETFKAGLDQVGKFSPVIGSITKNIKSLIPLIKASNDTAVKGLAGVKKAIASTGIGLIVIAVGELIAHWKDFLNLVTGNRAKEAQETFDNLQASFTEMNFNIQQEITLMQAEGATLVEVNEKKLELLNIQLAEVEALIAANKARVTEINQHSWIRRWLTGENNERKELNETLEEQARLQDELNKKVSTLLTENIADEIKAKKKAEDEKLAAAKKRYEEEKKMIEDIKKRTEEANKTELQKLEEKYKKEKELLKKYGLDTTAIDNEFKNSSATLNANTLVNAINTDIATIRNNPFLDKATQGSRITGIYFNMLDEVLAIEGDNPELENIKKQFSTQMLNDVYDITQEALSRTLSEYWSNGKHINVSRMTEQYNIGKVILNDLLTVPLFDGEERAKLMSKVKNDTSDFVNAYRKMMEEVIDDEIATNRWNANKNLMANYVEEMPHTIADALFKIPKNTQYSISALEKNLEKAYETQTLFLDLFEEFKNTGLGSDKDIMKGNEAYVTMLENLVNAEQALLQQRISNWNEMTSAVSANMDAFTDIWENNIAWQEENGKLSEEAAYKRYEEMKKMKIASATVQTLQGALAAFMSSQELGQPWGYAIGIAQASAVLAQGFSQIQQIERTNPYSKSNSSNLNTNAYAGALPMRTDYSPDYVANMTNQSDILNLQNALKNVNISVSVSDINKAQNKVKVRQTASTF